MKRGDRIVVMQRTDIGRGGFPVKRAGQTGTVYKLNGTEVMVQFDATGELAWVRRKWLSVQDQQPQPA